jgi:transcriptional regulator with XRE-family HTH domain
MQVENEKKLVDANLAFARRLGQFMKRLDLTQAQASTAMGVTDSTFQNYLYGNTYPSVDKIDALARAFGYEPKWFFQDEAEIGMQDVKQAVIRIDSALGNKDMDSDKKGVAVAMTARILAREREIGTTGDFEQRITAFVQETLSLLK